MHDLLLAKLTEYDQQHVLRFWDDLNESERKCLAQQIDSLDLALINRLTSGPADKHDWPAMARRASRPGPSGVAMPPPTILADRTSEPVRRERGAAALAAGEVGVLVVAGGQGTRFGFAHPKSLYPIGPVSAASVVQIHIEKVRSIAARYGVRIPLYLMTSPATHDETVSFLDKHDRFGQPTEDLFVFCQGTMPAVDAETGKLLLADRGALFLSPNGHGGTVAALEDSGAVDDAHSRGLRQLFYLQVDNPLVPICNAEFLGDHLLCESEMSSLAIAKVGPDDKVGNFVSIDGRTQVIEYIDFPDDVAEQRESDGSLRFWAGSIAIHVFDITFLDRVLTQSDALPFHIANKKVPHLDKNGNRIEPNEPNALKFERFIFDLLPEAHGAIVVEMAEEDIYAPLKNAPGADQFTAKYVQSLILAQHRRWLEAAGADVADGAAVEISPLFALDEQGIKERIKPGTAFDGEQYLVSR